MDTSPDLKPLLFLRTAAEYFHRDAVDFAARFDCLWEAGPLMHKMGRTKSFVDLMMGCECALKCDGLLTGQNEDPVIVYKRVRGCGHKIQDLLAHARFCDVKHYEALHGEFANMPVHIRYSRDAYDAFFPALMNWDSADFDYARTIGNNSWVLRIRETLEALNESVTREFSGEVTNDIDAIFAHEREFKEFTEACRR